MFTIFKNEWKAFLRNKLFLFFSVFFISLLIVTTYFGIIQNNQQIQNQKSAQEHMRKQWEEMGPYNAHSAAHFGTYAFKPNSILSNLDEGVNAVTGIVLRLEGHKQNDVAFSEASQSIFVSQFGKFKISLLFQFIIPLLLIFFSFNIYTSEITSGRLKLLIVQGNSFSKIIFAKIMTLLSFAALLFIISILFQLLFNYNQIGWEQIFRLSIFLIAYLLYYLIIISFTVLVSLIFKNNTSALSLTLICWFLWTIFLPKTIGSFTENLTTQPSRFSLQNSMDEDRAKGIDGHNPEDKRIKDLEAKVLEEYNVDSLSQLPINFYGILLQADEEYGNKVWDKHYGKLYSNLIEQKKHYQLSGIINPFASLQSLSMAASGTDLIHHLDFLNKAEIYRRGFIKALNHEYTYGDFKIDGGNLSSSDFFKSINDFNYIELSIQKNIFKYFTDILFLILWTIILLLIIHNKTKKYLINE
ncbi:MAG: hypothetical protein CMD15_01580 [Flavobacteriales bacterium]|nr:hypothetical protein [Flavobacteriales bacterium]|tara:strand:+ start:64104 stop:65513 length:1410 start_codon:yes stop_codon:yes gene_type:complete